MLAMGNLLSHRIIREPPCRCVKQANSRPWPHPIDFTDKIKITEKIKEIFPVISARQLLFFPLYIRGFNLP
jgi:hypothetical protein